MYTRLTFVSGGLGVGGSSDNSSQVLLTTVSLLLVGSSVGHIRLPLPCQN